MNDNETGIKNVKAPNFKESEITLSETKSFDTGEVEIIFPIRSTQSQIKEYIELSELYIQDVEPPKYEVQKFESSDFIATGTGVLNGLPLDYEIKIDENNQLIISYPDNTQVNTIIGQNNKGYKEVSGKEVMDILQFISLVGLLLLGSCIFIYKKFFEKKK